MEQLLEVTRVFRTLIWTVILIWLSGSVWREMRRVPTRDYDEMWALIWFLGTAVSGYNLRWIVGLSPASETSTDLAVRLALNILIAITGLAVIWQKKAQGGRW